MEQTIISYRNVSRKFDVPKATLKNTADSEKISSFDHVQTFGRSIELSK